MKNMKRHINARTLFYLVTIFSVVIFIMGNVITIADNTLNNSVFNILNRDYFDILTIFVPFSISVWLIITGLLFIKKNWVVIWICVVLSIPHVIAIALLYAHSYSVLYILKWYLMILSFGILR